MIWPFKDGRQSYKGSILIFGILLATLSKVLYSPYFTLELPSPSLIHPFCTKLLESIDGQVMNVHLKN